MKRILHAFAVAGILFAASSLTAAPETTRKTKVICTQNDQSDAVFTTIFDDLPTCNRDCQGGFCEVTGINTSVNTSNVD